MKDVEDVFVRCHQDNRAAKVVKVTKNLVVLQLLGLRNIPIRIKKENFYKNWYEAV